MIPEDKVAEIRERTDLVALVSGYISLKRSGTGLKGLCPFHSEKTPSFYVHPDRGFFHCFGCQASGDAISFLMRVDGHPFPEAVRILAERAGIDVTPFDSTEEKAARQARARTERLLSIVDAAAGFFVRMLSEHTLGAVAWDELRRRNISASTVERFRLGYAPHAWDELAQFLAARGFSPRDCEQVGLVVPRRRGSGHYDRFRHRLMFPIADAHGRIVAFSGRALEPPRGEEQADREPPAKYVNSPETLLYKKGDILFGLYEARIDLRRRDAALLCEGNFDVLALSQAGFANVVAPLGTALTAQQAKLLRRYVSTAVLVFDADAAGRKAVRAAHPVLAAAGLAGKVVTLPPGDDPDSFLREQGPEGMARLIASAPGIVEWLIDATATEAGADPRAKADAIESLGPVLAAIDNPVEARLYVDRVARSFEVRDVQAVRQQLRRGARSNSSGRGRVGPLDPALRPRSRPVPLPKTERDLVGAFLDFPHLHSSDCAEKVQEILTSGELRAIFGLTARWVGARGVDASALLDELGNENPARDWLEERLALQGFEDEESARTFVNRAIEDLRTRHIEREGKRLSRQILDARRAGDDERADALMRQRMELFRSARRDSPGRERAEGTKR